MLKRHSHLGWLVGMVACLFLSACDVVKLDSNGKPIIPMSASDAASIKNMSPEDLAEKFWPEIVLEANQKALTLDSLTQLSGKENRFIKLTGTVKGIDSATKTATMVVSASSSDVTLQIGPIIRGNSIRDAASFIEFDQFKNQVQFARLSKELNKKAMASFPYPDTSWTGKKVEVIAAVTVTNHKILEAIPIEITQR